MEKVALVSLGCAKNLVDSEVMLGILDKQKYELVPEIEIADIIIINTCGFIQPARKEAWDNIKKAVREKNKAGDKKIIVSGCYVQRSQDSLKKAFPEVDAWMGVTDFDKIGLVIQGKSYESTQKCFLYDHTHPRLLSTPPSWAYVKISEGCSHSCSFCAIPLIKGFYRSRNIPSIIEEVRMLVSRGIREINLVSQDTTFFGRDIGLKDGLVLLLDELLTIDDLECSDLIDRSCLVVEACGFYVNDDVGRGIGHWEIAYRQVVILGAGLYGRCSRVRQFRILGSFNEHA